MNIKILSTVEDDKQIETDSSAGRLDCMINEALEDYHAGQAIDLK